MTPPRESTPGQIDAHSRMLEALFCLQRSCPAAAAEHYPSAPECPLSHGKAAKPFQAGAPSLSAKENVHTNSPQVIPSQCFSDIISYLGLPPQAQQPMLQTA